MVPVSPQVLALANLDLDLKDGESHRPSADAEENGQHDAASEVRPTAILMGDAGDESCVVVMW